MENKAESKKCYKVVYCRGYGSGLFESAVVDGKWSVTYKIGKWSYPSIEDSALMAFATIDDVERFYLPYYVESSKYYILECEYEDYDGFIPSTLADPHSSLFEDVVMRFWRGKINPRTHTLSIPELRIPDGTIFCSKIKPLRVIKS